VREPRSNNQLNHPSRKARIKASQQQGIGPVSVRTDLHMSELTYIIVHSFLFGFGPRNPATTLTPIRSSGSSLPVYAKSWSSITKAKVLAKAGEYSFRRGVIRRNSSGRNQEQLANS